MNQVSNEVGGWFSTSTENGLFVFPIEYSVLLKGTSTTDVRTISDYKFGDYANQAPSIALPEVANASVYASRIDLTHCQYYKTANDYQNGATPTDCYNYLPTLNTVLSSTSTRSFKQLLNGGGIDLKANTQGSGSSFTSISSVIDTASDPSNVYSAFQMIKPNGDALLNMAVNSYSPQYSTALPMILANGNNPDGNNTAIIWTANGQAEHWKKSNFKYGADVTGSVKITQVMNLKPQNPLPSGTIGDMAVSGSNLYFYNGSWTLVV